MRILGEYSRSLIHQRDRLSELSAFSHQLSARIPLPMYIGTVLIPQSLCFDPSGVQQLFPKVPWLKEEGIESYLAVPIFDSAGRPLGHMGVAHVQPMDETCRYEAILRFLATRTRVGLQCKQAEEALRLGETRFRTTFESAAIARAVGDAHGS